MAAGIINRLVLLQKFDGSVDAVGHGCAFRVSNDEKISDARPSLSRDYGPFRSPLPWAGDEIPRFASGGAAAVHAVMPLQRVLHWAGYGSKAQCHCSPARHGIAGLASPDPNPAM
jgi:hypothetical protein